MTSEQERFTAFQKMVRESTDPQWVREQIGRPHQYSRTFTVLMLFLGTAAAYGALFACASI
jgi:hypothetical protein